MSKSASELLWGTEDLADAAGLLEAIPEIIAVVEAAGLAAAKQQKALAIIRANGFVFDDIGQEPGNWQHLAFSLYTDLCEIESYARPAIANLASKLGGEDSA